MYRSPFQPPDLSSLAFPPPHSSSGALLLSVLNLCLPPFSSQTHPQQSPWSSSLSRSRIMTPCVGKAELEAGAEKKLQCFFFCLFFSSELWFFFKNRFLNFFFIPHELTFHRWNPLYFFFFSFFFFFSYNHSVFHIQPVISYITQSDSSSPQRGQHGLVPFSCGFSLWEERERYKYFFQSRKKQNKRGVMKTT